MQDEHPIEEIVIGRLPWYQQLLSSEDWVLLTICGVAVIFGLLALRQRHGKPWIGWFLVLTSIPALFSLFQSFMREVSPLSVLLSPDVDVMLLQMTVPFLFSVLILLWKLRLLVSVSVSQRTKLLAASLLAMVVFSDLNIVVDLQGDWLFPEPTPYIFGIVAVLSVVSTLLVLRNRISAPASVSVLLMMTFIVHSTVMLSTVWDNRDPDLGLGFYASLLAVAIFAAEIGYTVVREWGAERYWAWEVDRLND